MRHGFSSKEVSQTLSDLTLRHQLYQPDTQAPQAMILLFPAFEGWSSFIEQYAEFFSSAGFLTVAVDFYGQRQSASDMAGCFSLVGPYLDDRALVRSRAQQVFQYWHDLFPALQVGAMGFCFGVQSVLELARSQPLLKAGVGAHGMLACSDLPSLDVIETALLMLQGYSDPLVPPEQCLDFAQEMKKHHVADWNLMFFGQAKHSFTDPQTGNFEPEKEKDLGRVFDALAARRVQRLAKDFFEQTLLLLS